MTLGLPLCSKAVCAYNPEVLGSNPPTEHNTHSVFVVLLVKMILYLSLKLLKKRK